MKATLLSLYFILAVFPTARVAAQEKSIRIGFPSVAFQELTIVRGQQTRLFPR